MDNNDSDGKEKIHFARIMDQIRYDDFQKPWEVDDEDMDSDSGGDKEYLEVFQQVALDKLLVEQPKVALDRPSSKKL
jgi:hypothetical protein